MKGKKNKHSKKSKCAPISQKVALAQLKNEYCRRYTRVAKALGALEIYKKFDETDHKLLWLGRVRSIRVEPDCDVKIPSLLLTFFRKWISYSARNTMTRMIPDGPEVTLEDYFTAGTMFGIFTRTLTAADSGKTEQQVNEIKKAFEPVARHDRYPMPYTQLLAIGLNLARTLSRPTSKIYSVRYDVHNIESSTSADCLYLNSISAPTLSITIDGIKRQCYQLCWPGFNEDFAWGSVNGTTLGIDGSFAKLQFDLYIQPHALHRLRERTTPINPISRYSALYLSLDNPQYHAVKPGTSLLEYRYNNTLLGYFLVEAVSGVALIKTFLFITNSGTPEGNMLDRILNARKSDKAFTEIDKLSTFMTTDILKNTRLRTALIEAGLEPLVNYCETNAGETACKNGFSSFFNHYMGFTPEPSKKQPVATEEEIFAV